MTPEELDALSEQVPQHPVPTPTVGRLENVTVFKADGRVIDLGRPGTVRFRYRHRRYLRSTRG